MSNKYVFWKHLKKINSITEHTWLMRTETVSQQKKYMAKCLTWRRKKKKRKKSFVNPLATQMLLIFLRKSSQSLHTHTRMRAYAIFSAKPSSRLTVRTFKLGLCLDFWSVLELHLVQLFSLCPLLGAHFGGAENGHHHFLQTLLQALHIAPHAATIVIMYNHRTLQQS